MTKVTCNGCGYTGGPDGQDWETTLSAYSWGRCPKCGTTNLEIEQDCPKCKGKMDHGVYGMVCKPCSQGHITQELGKERP